MDTTYSGDTEAAWTVKTKNPYYGYKAYIAVDAEHGFILAGHATPANWADCKEIMTVVKKCSLDRGAPVFAEKGYSGAEYRSQLEDAGYSTVSRTRRPGFVLFQSQSVWSTGPSTAFEAR